MKNFDKASLETSLELLQGHGNKPALWSAEFRDFCRDSYEDEMADDCETADQFVRICIEVWLPFGLREGAEVDDGCCSQFRNGAGEMSERRRRQSMSTKIGLDGIRYDPSVRAREALDSVRYDMGILAKLSTPEEAAAITARLNAIADRLATCDALEAKAGRSKFWCE
jgi:hypothetical protein